MRVEMAELARLEVARHTARAQCDFLLWQLDSVERERYWRSVEVLYYPYYAYEEVLAAIADRPGSHLSMLAAFERVTAYLTSGEVRELRPLPVELRIELLSRYGNSWLQSHEEW